MTSEKHVKGCECLACAKKRKDDTVVVAFDFPGFEGSVQVPAGTSVADLTELARTLLAQGEKGDVSIGRRLASGGRFYPHPWTLDQARLAEAGTWNPLNADMLMASARKMKRDVRCQHCSWGLRWKNDTWWAQAKENGHVFCDKNATAEAAERGMFGRHEPVVACCVMKDCGCPYHYPDTAPQEFGVQGTPDLQAMLEKAAAIEAKHAQYKNHGPEPVPPVDPMDQLYSGTTGRRLPARTYIGWGEEFIETGNQYAKEQMVARVDASTPGPDWKWDAPLPVAAVPSPAAIAAARNRASAKRIWLLALVFFVLGAGTGMHFLMTIGVVMWGILFASQLGGRFRSTSSRKTKAVEGKHAKPE
jgi:hypothetical protein